MNVLEGSVVYDDKGKKYKVENMISRGGFSSVYKIMEEETRKYYALKTFSGDFENKIELESFKNEMSKAIQIESENVVKYLFFNDGEVFPELQPYIIMEYCDGGTLEEYIRKIKESGKNIENVELKNIFLQLIRGMKSINSKIVHRDIKLKNIMIHEGIIKIGDFGISKDILESTRTKTFKGCKSVEYFAPEGWRGEKNTIKMDMYSMGIVFYQIATLLNYPYNMTKYTEEDFRSAHLYGNVISLKQYNKNIEYSIETTILKMLEKNPENRFGDWEEIESKILVEKASENSKILDEILKRRISVDEEKRKREIEETKRRENINERKKRINYSIYENIYKPIKELIDGFNMQYASGNIRISDYSVNSETISNIYVNTISGKRVEIKIQSIIDQKFTQEYQDPFYGEYYEQEYRPELKNREILAWGSVNYANKLSYNLILITDTENIYGKWYQIKNRESAFYENTRETEVFAYDFDEIEEGIKYINAINQYKSTLEEYNAEEMLKNIGEIICEE